MITVYQLGRAQIMKDMIFGWALRSSDEDAWMLIRDLPIEALQVLSEGSYPAYIPEEFKANITAELKKKLTA